MHRLVFFSTLIIGAAWSSGCTGEVGSSGSTGDTGGDTGLAGGEGIDGDAGGDAAGDATGDAAPACPTDQHRCTGVCVDDTAVETCGSRCTPCPPLVDGTAICTASVCGFTCDIGFFACLGACLPDAQAPCGVSLSANTWVQLTTGDTGPRTQAAMIYLAATGEYVLVGGSMGISEVPRPYDEQVLTLTDLRWRNQFPLNQVGVWTPEFGDSNAPNFPNESFGFADSQGNMRPNWATYPGIPSYYQYAFNPTTQRLVMYLWNRTFSYDATARTWTLHSPATDPAASESRLLWGAMAFDEIDNKVLLFGGGNVLDADGRPGTWIYEVDNDVWRQVAGSMPGPRALAPLMTDPDRRQVLLFGGDELDRLMSETWIFDFAGESWSQVTPTVSPSPRAGHYLVFLPTSRATVLVGGYRYSSTTDYVSAHFSDIAWEIWRFDWDTPTWDLVKHFDGAEVQPGIWRARNFTTAHAVGDGDILVMQGKDGYTAADSESWALRIDPSVIDTAGTTTYGVAPGTEELRTGAYDPVWYETGWPAPDPTAFSTLLNGLANNVWTEIDVPNRPAHNHDWGTAAIDPVRKRIFRWSGGHSAHSGTEVLEYDMTDNRFSLSFAPEIPLDFEFTNDQTPGQWSFDNNPWMTGHTYKTYAYSAAADRVVFYKRPYTYYYDPDLHDFELDPVPTGIGGSMYTDVLCEVPAGMVAWTPNGLFELDVVNQTWSALTVTGAALAGMSPDSNILVYEPGVDRLLLFSTVGNARGQVFAYAMGSGVLSELNPTGQIDLNANGPGFFREAVYVASSGLVVIGSDFDSGDGRPRTPVYDIGQNRWYGYDFDAGGAQGSFYDVSLGLVIDAQERVWAINTASHMYLLKVDAASADRVALN